jgi:hypothetical protein
MDEPLDGAPGLQEIFSPLIFFGLLGERPMDTAEKKREQLPQMPFGVAYFP